MFTLNKEVQKHCTMHILSTPTSSQHPHTPYSTTCILKKQQKRHTFIVLSAPFDHGYEKVLAAIDRSLEALGRSYVDLYLVHFPGVRGLKREDPQNAVVRRETWRAMEEIYRSGKAITGLVLVPRHF